jgi:serralysin
MALRRAASESPSLWGVAQLVDIPGNSSTTATVTVGSTTNGTLETFGDHDWFRITLTAGESITVTVNGVTLEDPYLYVRDSAGNLLYENDDINLGTNRNSQLSFTATYSGTYFIDVGAWDEGYTGDYQVVVNTYTPPPVASVEQIADQLVEGFWGGSDHHFNVTQGGSLTVNITALTAAGQTLARAALSEWTEIIGVNFVEVSTAAQITFDDNEPGAFSDSIWSGGIISSSTVNVSTQWLAQYGTGTNTYSFQTYIHEIGHALGLGHAGNYNGEASYPDDALFQNDAWATSIMSYFSQTENTYFAGQGFDENFLITPMMADIYAMSLLYGLSTTTRAGNTTYGQGEWHTNMGALCIFDSGGIDTIDCSGMGGNQLINLNPGSFSNILGEVGNVSIALGVVIENAVGGSGDDSLIGNAVANVLTGNAGNDILNGGAGADTLIGGFGNDRYVVDQTGDVIVEGAGEGGEDWVFASASYGLTAGAYVEVLGTTWADGTAAISLTGNELAQSIYGNAGANLLAGGGGADGLNGGFGNDIYVINNANVLIVERANEGAEDWVFSGVSYGLTAGAHVEVLGTSWADGTAAINLTGNELAQSIYGNAGANIINGGGGADRLIGGFGNDIYVVNDASVTIAELADESGEDWVFAGVSYGLNAGAHVEVLGTSWADGTAAINLTGNELAQSIYGNAGANVLAAGGGADTLVGGGGNDRFILSSLALSGPGNIATVADYASGDIVDLTQLLILGSGADPVGGGYLKATAGGQLQVDLSGGGDSWVTIANVPGSGPITIRYISGGIATDLSVSRSASAEAGAAVKLSAEAETWTGVDHLPALPGGSQEVDHGVLPDGSEPLQAPFDFNHLDSPWLV